MAADHAALEQALEYLQTSQYSNAINSLRPVITKANLNSYISTLLAINSTALPSTNCAIYSSRSAIQPALTGNILELNNPHQFIFYANDSNPWVVIDIGEVIDAHSSIFLYNRCHGKEISERIIGCNFYTSCDSKNWSKQSITLDNDQIYKRKGIRISSDIEFRFLKINREFDSPPIHLSQITIRRPLMSEYVITKFCNKLFARVHGLKISSNGKIAEHSSRKRFMSFQINGTEKELSIQISKAQRFSNLLYQITHAIYFALKTKINNIYIPDNERVRNLFPNHDIILCKSYPITIRIGGNPRGPCLKGDFFYTCEHKGIFTKTSPSTRRLVEEFQEYTELAPLHDSKISCHLTIHIRSGDIFSSFIHPGYGQPPLSYYILAIKHYSPKLVTLVFEDKANPVISKLINYLESIPMEYAIQSSKHIREDIKFLIAADALVISRGTFAKGILCFNQSLKAIYTFEGRVDNGLLPQVPGRVVSLFDIIDGTKEYVEDVMRKNWSNSKQQRDLMINYPEQNLHLQSHSYQVPESNAAE